MKILPVLALLTVACVIVVAMVPAPTYYEVGAFVHFDGRFAEMRYSTMHITKSHGAEIELTGIPRAFWGQLIIGRRVRGWGYITEARPDNSVVIQVTGLEGIYQ